MLEVTIRTGRGILKTRPHNKPIITFINNSGVEKMTIDNYLNNILTVHIVQKLLARLPSGFETYSYVVKTTQSLMSYHPHFVMLIPYVVFSLKTNHQFLISMLHLYIFLFVLQVQENPYVFNFLAS